MKIAIVPILLVCAIAGAQTSAMKTYANSHLGLELQYPADYRVADLPCPIATWAAYKGLQSLLYVTTGTGEHAANIRVWLDRRKFGLAALQLAYAHTGIDDPPYEVHAGKMIFYSYAGGAGGAQYPDDFFYDVGSSILVITFDGPYQDGEKTPSNTTKDIEKRVLETVRVQAVADTER